MRLSLIFFSITILLGCSDKENNSSEIYLGTYRVADRMIPYPYLIKQKKIHSFFLMKVEFVLIKQLSIQ